MSALKHCMKFRKKIKYLASPTVHGSYEYFYFPVSKYRVPYADKFRHFQILSDTISRKIDYF